MAAPSKRGRRLHALLDAAATRRKAVDEILEAYISCGFAIERTCDRLHIQRSTLARWRRKYTMLAIGMLDVTCK